MHSTQKIKVLVVDDHPIITRGLATLIDTFDDFEVVGTAEDGAMAVTLCHNFKPDVVVMDLIMPGMNSIDAIQEILAKRPQIRIIGLSSTTDEKLIHAALQAGACGFLSKVNPVDNIAQAIRRVKNGEPFLDTLGVESLLSYTRQDNGGNPFNLTRRQREVLDLMTRGLNNAQIAAELTVTVSTVKNHINTILTKLNVDNRSSAVAFALRNKLLVEPKVP